MAYLEIDNLTVQYGKTVALESFGVHASNRDFIVILGPSGSGKSSLLLGLCGLVSLKSGEIRIAGKRVDALPPGKRNIAMVFQDGALFPHLTVRKNIELPLRAVGLPRIEREKEIQSVTGLLEISSLLKRKPSQLSGGEKRRVAIARAMVKHPDIFLFDEPLNSLDPHLRHRLIQELIRLHERVSVPVVYVSHDQHEALELASKIAVLKQGVTQQIDTPEKIYERPANTFVASFVGSPPMNMIRYSPDDQWFNEVLFCDRIKPSPEIDMLGFRPEDVHISDGGDTVLQRIRIIGADCICNFSRGNTNITVRVKRGKTFSIGSRYDVSIPRGTIHVFDNNGRRLQSL